MKKKIVKTLIGLGILCGVILFVLPIILTCWPDHSLADHSDLVPHIVEVPESLTAPLVEFGKIDFPKMDDDAAVIFHKKPISERTEEEWQILERYLQQTESFHHQFLELSKLPEWKAPIVDSYDDLILHREPIRDAVQDCALRAQVLHHQERTDEAIDMALIILQSGKKYSQTGGTIIEGFVAQSITSIAVHNLCHIFQSDSISLSQIDQVSQALQHNKPAKDDFSDCFRREFQINKNTVLNLLNGSATKIEGVSPKRVKYKYLFQPNHTVNRLADCYREMIDALEHNKFTKNYASYNYFEYETKFDLIKSPNLIGKIVSDVSLATTNRFTYGFARTEARLNLLTTLLAIRKF